MNKITKSALAIAVLAAFAAGRASAGIINPGYDLLETTTPTTFLGQNFQGVPVGSYNFGAGALNTGNTDTIIHRLNADPDTTNLANVINTQMVMLQLRSVTQF